MRKRDTIKQCVRFKGESGKPAARDVLPGKELAEFVAGRLKEKNFVVEAVEDEEIWYSVKVKSGTIEYPLMVCRSCINEEYWEISCPRTIGFWGRLFGKSEETEIQNLMETIDEILRGDERITDIKWYGDYGELCDDYARKKGEKRLITVGNYFEKLFFPVCAIGMGLIIIGIIRGDKDGFFLLAGGIIFALPFIGFLAMFAINIFWGLFSDIRESFQKKKKKKWISWLFGVFLLSLFIGPFILGFIKNPAIERVMPVILKYMFRLMVLVFFSVMALIFSGLLVRSFSKIFIPRYREKGISKNVITLTGSILILMGFTGFLSGFFAALGMLKWLPASVELPLAVTENAAVDRNGNLYVASNFYSRIQEYDSKGEYIRGWFLDDTGGGALKIKVNDENEVEVVIAKDNRIDSFDENGRLLKSKKFKHYTDFQESFEQNGKHIFDETTGQEYSIKGWIFTKVIQSGPKGERRIGPKAWYLFPLQGPFQAIVTAMLGGVLMRQAEKKKKK